MKTPFVLVLAILLAFAGCGGSSHARLSTHERLWVSNYTVWLKATLRAVTRGEVIRQRIAGGAPGTRADYDDAVAPVRTCRERFDDRVGNAPTARLAAVQKLALRACTDFQHAARAASRAFVGAPGDALVEWGAAMSNGTRVSFAAQRELERLFAWNRPLPVRTGEADTSRVEPRFSRVASTLASRPVQVRCWSRADWPGVLEERRAFTAHKHPPIGFVASFDSGRLSLAPDICGHLAAFVYGGDPPKGVDAAEAVEALAHEAEHLAAPGTEAVTECYGMQDVRRTARLLGTDRNEAAKLARVAWLDIYPQRPRNYRTALCRDGGPLDRNRSSSVWP